MKKDATIPTIRVPAHVRCAFDVLAEKAKRPLSDYVRIILVDHITGQEVEYDGGGPEK